MLSYFETEKVFLFNRIIIIIRRPGLRHFFNLTHSVMIADIAGIVRLLPEFIKVPDKVKRKFKLTGDWKVNELLSLANEVLAFNMPDRKKKKQKKNEEQEVRENPINKQDLEKTVEEFVARLVDITGWTLDYIFGALSYYHACKLMKSHNQLEILENIRQMINFNYGYNGNIKDYKNRMEITDDNLDNWAGEMGFGDWDGFIDAEKERWKEVL